MTRRKRLVSLASLLARQRPDVADPVKAIGNFEVQVDGAIMTNPRAMVREDASIAVKAHQPPRGVEKLGYALDALQVAVHGMVALDVGASTGGFTKALIDRGAAKVYAVDVGYGQLLGSLRSDVRVVNLERTNVSELDSTLVPDTVDVIVVDVSKISLGEAVRQLTSRVVIRHGADLVGLIKPMFELRLGVLPGEPAQFEEARNRAVGAIEGVGWEIKAVIDSAVRGNKGAVEFFVHATYTGGS